MHPIQLFTHSTIMASNVCTCRSLVVQLIAAVVVVYSVLSTPVAAYQYGQPISMLRRSQQKSWRTAWTDVLRRHLPRFGESSTVQLAPVPLSGLGHITATHDLKMSFAFSNQRFIVPWITVTDGKGRFLQALEVTFVHSASDIERIRWSTKYLETGVATDGQPQIELRYVWQSTSDVNVELGVSALFVGTCLAGVLACTAVFYDHRKDLSRWLHDME